MKEETKNEMDLLLRRLGRRDDAGVPETDHLDADELSAYAENALPVAARARYTAHLTECSRCRELIVQLSSAVGVIAATDTANVSKPSAWRTFLASLFTPMVLRYAAPALVLIVVAGIGFMVLRRDQRSAKFVTQVTNNDQRPSVLPTAEPTGTVYDSLAKTEPSPEVLADKQTKTQQPAPAPNAPPVVSNVEANTSKDKAEQPKPEQQTAAANEPPPPPPAKTEPSATPEESQKPADAEWRKKEMREQPTTATPTAQRAARADEEKDRNTNNFSRPPKTTDRVSGIASAGSVADLKRDELSANTRSVAGRRFQKKGGVWIDNAYDSSKDAVTLTRGSEQYRALVADEPAIKTIADELDGEIIVVWKGHTYRIR
jgi:hypothetical protein